MKTTTACLSALSLATLAAAVPSGHRRHQQLHEKRDEVVTVVDYVTSQMPDVVVYVDESGNVLSSATTGQVPTAAAAAYEEAPASNAEPTSVYVAPTTQAAASVYQAPAEAAPTEAAPTTSSVAPPPPATTQAPTTQATSEASTSSVAPTTSSAAAPKSSAASGPSGYGIVYSPYLDDGSCKSSEQVSADFEDINGYDFVRSYGVDCKQVETILSAVKAKGMKLWVGVYDVDKVADQVKTIIDTVGKDWDSIHTVSIGNEGVNSGLYTVDAVVSAIGTAKTLLKAAGANVNVVTVDTFVATIAHPELCEASDFAAVNCHPFFDGNVEAKDAGPFVLEQMHRVSSACNGKNTWITETGWPTKGGSNGKAVPGVEQQKSALASIRETISSNVILFSSFNDYWKQDSSSTYGCEKYWGMFGNSRWSKSS